MFWEALIMVVLDQIALENKILDGTLDTCTLAALSGISIWFLIYRPEKKYLEKKSNESLFFHQQILNSVDSLAMISITDSLGNIIYANDNFCTISGYSKAELLNQNHRITNSGYHDRLFFKTMWDKVNSGLQWNGHVRNKKKDGNIYWVNSYLSSIANNNNEIINYFAIQFDITNDRLLQSALETEKIKSIHMSRLSLLGEMASGIAHEINNPLAIIGGFISSIDRKLHSPNLSDELPLIFQSIEKIEKQVFRISKIINGLKDFSRSNVGTDYIATPIDTIVQAIVQLCSERLKNTGVNLDVDCDNSILKCNPIQIEQVLINLISNSLDAIQTADQKWIRLACKQKGDFAELSITDSGFGIPTEIADKVMDPFFTTKEIGKGTGLGLSISKGLIESHGGSLEINRNSKNTCFMIRIPLYEITKNT